MQETSVPRGSTESGRRELWQIRQTLATSQATTETATEDGAYTWATLEGIKLEQWLKDRKMVPAKFKTAKCVSFDDLNLWGWHRDEIAEDPEPELPPGPDALVKHQFGEQVHWENSRTVEVDGIVYRATHANFENTYWPEHGIISAENNASPARLVPDLRTDVASEWYKQTDWQYTRLNKWSNITFLTWQHLCNNDVEKVQSLRWVQRSRILNKDTRLVISKALKNAGRPDGTAPAWPGKRFTLKDEGFDAVLGTPNVVGVIFMLLQHEDRLGSKIVSALTVFNPDPDYADTMSIWVELQDV